LIARYGAERAERIATVRHVFVFPSLYLMDEHVRVFRPVAVDRTDAYSYFTWFDGVSAEINRLRLRVLQANHSQAGVIRTDDVEMFVGCQSGMQAAGHEYITLSRGLPPGAGNPAGVVAGP